MNLFQWKQKKTETFREQLKDQIRQGFDISEHFLFSQEEIEEIKEEIFIEDFSEIVEDFEVLDLDDDNLFESSEVQEAFEFLPEKNGHVMDIEVEADLQVVEMSLLTLGKIRDLFFAEDYEVEVLDESSKAIIVFKRSHGKVIKKKKCGKGMRLVGNRCLPQTGTQKSKERRRGIKLKRAFKAMGKGKKKKAALKRKITATRVKGRARSLGNTEN